MEMSLVTGGTGFIGRSLVNTLAARGQRVRVLGRRSVIGWRGNSTIEHIRADIGQPGVLANALEGVDRVFHLAAATQGTPNFYETVTVKCSERLMELIAAKGGGRVIFVSSLSVYDASEVRDGTVLDENCPVERNPFSRGIYARTKAAADLVAQRYLNHPTVKVTIVRPGIVFGPRMKNPLNGVALPFKNRIWVTTGTASKRLPLIYIDDMVEVLFSIATTDAAIGQIYNAINPEMPTNSEYLALYRSISGDKRPVIDIPVCKFLFVFAAIDRLKRAMGKNSNLAYTASRLTANFEYAGQRVWGHLNLRPRIGAREGLELLFGNSK